MKLRGRRHGFHAFCPGELPNAQDCRLPAPLLLASPSLFALSPEARSMPDLKITAGPFVFDARLETKDAPKTCASFLSRLPFESHVVHVRWSGEGVWIPLGDMDFKVGYENHTSYPAPGQIVLYPGGISETEILLAYGGVHFACKMGQLAGNHFITITSGLENLAKLGKMTLWEGAQKIRFEKA